MNRIINNVFKIIKFLIILIIFPVKRQIKNEKRIFIIRLDGIGDYILFRNFIEIIYKSEKYKDYKITLCGRDRWKDLAETFDRKYVDDFIWINRESFNKKISYRYSILKRIRKRNYTFFLQPVYSSAYLDIAQAIKAKRKFTYLNNQLGKVDKLLMKKIYTNFNSTTDDIQFEFERNKSLIENFINEKINITTPYFKLKSLKGIRKNIGKYIILFPGAGFEIRRWNTSYFVEVIDYLTKEKSNYKIAIIGGVKEKEIGKIIVKSANNSKNIINLAGKISLSEVVYWVKESSLLLSNETGIVHIAAALNTKTICISNGNHFGRFHPYPQNKVNYVYHPFISNNIHHTNKMKDYFGKGSKLPINEIKPEMVIKHLKKL